MNIAYITDDLYPGYGGQAAAAEGHIEALAKLGHHIRVLAGHEAKPSTAPVGVEVERAVAIRIKTFQMHFALPNPLQLQKLLTWADVVHINNPALLGLVAMYLAKLRQKPVILGVHTQEETATIHFKEPLKTLVRYAIRYWFRFFYHQVDLMISPTPFAARLASSYSPKPSHVVSNGLRWHALAQISPKSKSQTRQRYLKDGKKFLLSYVGRLALEKRPEGLLEIMEYLSSLRQDTVLVIAGDGPMRQLLEKTVKARKLEAFVQFAGFVSEQEKFALLAASDVFIMPSPTELQSIASLEAMAQRCAIVAARVDSSAVSEMVEAAHCGLTYALDESSEIAIRLSALLDDPERLACYQSKALATARKHDTLQSAQQLLVLYQACLDSRFEKFKTKQL